MYANAIVVVPLSTSPTQIIVCRPTDGLIDAASGLLVMMHNGYSAKNTESWVCVMPKCCCA